MASQVQICNLALSRLGASTITSLTDNTTEAKLCNTFFDDLADEVMVEGSWSSTIARTSLARTTNTPSFGFTYEFQLPVDPLCLKVLAIDESVPGNIEYRIESDKLLIDESSVKIKYISQLQDTEDWDILLRKAFVARLSSELAYSLTGDTRKAEIEFERYEKFRMEGLSIDGQQGSKEKTFSTDFIEVR
jgi:hypothetical protein